MTNPTFPWKMDKPVEELQQDWDSGEYPMIYAHEVNQEFVDYLLHRLKLAEGERGRLVMKVQAAFYEGSSGVWKDDFDNWQLNYDIDTMD